MVGNESHVVMGADDGKELVLLRHRAPRTTVLLLFLALVTGCSGTQPAPTGTAARLKITSTWHDGASISPPYACTDEHHLGHSPSVSWSTGPAGTTSYAVTVIDTDAGGFLHWGVLGLPPSTTSLPEGASPGGRLPAGARELTNGYGATGYGGPCPPPGTPHHYVLTVWAVHGAATDYAGLRRVALGSGSVTVTYQR